VNEILAERTKLVETLQSISFVKNIYPTDANFILAKVDDATLRYNQLLKKGVVVRNRTTQPLCENSLRFTVGTTEENQKLIAALNKLL
jgi:histidinol-phosphate aminotransferase